MGGWFSTEQLTVQAWQPMHLRISTSMPKRLPSMPGRRVGWNVGSPGKAARAVLAMPKLAATAIKSCKKPRLLGAVTALAVTPRLLGGALVLQVQPVPLLEQPEDSWG